MNIVMAIGSEYCHGLLELNNVNAAGSEYCHGCWK
jgi:hypothetical protein